MTASEITGFIASALVLITFAMKDMRLLRVTAILSNIAFIIYGGVNWLLPVLVLHVLLLPLNILRLRENFKRAQSRRQGGARSKADRATEMAIEALHVANAARQQQRARSSGHPQHQDRSTRLCVG